jgi:DNA ligase-1
MQILYRKNKMGVGSWRIWSVDNRIQIAHSISSGGAEIIHEELVHEGLGGRTLSEQIQSRIDSRIKKQRDRGYVDSIDDALNNPLTNMLDLPPAMLAKRLDSMRGWAGHYVMQPKLDGFRCMIARTEKGVIAYTRGGIELTAITHITDPLQDKLPDGVVLDGEIYQHGLSLQVIASRAKRLQNGTGHLVYNVYDSVGTSSFEDRYQDAQDVIENVNDKHMIMVQNEYVKTEAHMWEMYHRYREMKYEGGILRSLRMPYEPGTRSSGLIKVKSRDIDVRDHDFEVVDVLAGSDGLGILVCKMFNGKTFKTLAPGDHGQKRFTLDNKAQFIGRMVTVQYANLTDDGIPFHCVAIRFKETIA